MRVLIPTLLTFLLFSCAPEKKILKNAISQDVDFDELTAYINKFEAAVENHDKNEVLKLLEPGYVKRQHDSFLSGNTEQFLNELLCGESLEDAKFACPGFDNISSTKLIKIKPHMDFYFAWFELKASGKTYTSRLPFVSEDGNPFRLAGAEG